MENFDLRKYLAEGKLLKEDKGINYLKDAFEIYLEGGDDFNKEVGETETVKFENDESLISKEKFKVALQSLPTTVKVDAYNVNFKKVGNDIIGTFKITEGKLLKENAPGYDTRKSGEALPTLESVKAAYEAKNDIKEEATEVFTDAELDMASEMLMDMYDKLGLEDSVERSDALFKVIEAFFETLD